MKDGRNYTTFMESFMAMDCRPTQTLNYEKIQRHARSGPGPWARNTGVPDRASEAGHPPPTRPGRGCDTRSASAPLPKTLRQSPHVPQRALITPTWADGGPGCSASRVITRLKQSTDDDNQAKTAPHATGTGIEKGSPWIARDHAILADQRAKDDARALAPWTEPDPSQTGT